MESPELSSVRRNFANNQEYFTVNVFEIVQIVTFAPGEVAEWSIAAVLKTVDCNRSGGSNPSFSATRMNALPLVGHLFL